MAAKKDVKQEQAAPAQESLYPAIEGFIEGAKAGDITSLFAPIKDGLATLKGPRAEQGKKVGKAIERTEELLSYLLEVREKIEADRKGGARGRK
jgi:hypothetical protein